MNSENEMKVYRPYRMITKNEEQNYQFSTKTRAIKAAKRLTHETGRNHYYILTTCYRNLVPLTCWYTYYRTGY